MAWTAPRTFITGEVVTASMLNEQIRDNELFLKAFPRYTTTGTTGTTASTTELVIATLVIADPGFAYTIIASAFHTADIAAAASTSFTMRVREDSVSGTVRGQVTETVLGTVAHGFAIPPCVPISVASGAKTIVATLQRLTGTVNASTNVAGRLSALVVAT